MKEESKLERKRRLNNEARKRYFLKNKDEIRKKDRERKLKKYNDDPLFRAQSIERRRSYYRLNRFKKKLDEDNVR